MGIRVLTAEDVKNQRDEVIERLKNMTRSYVFEEFSDEDCGKQFGQLEEEGNIVIDSIDVDDFLLDIEDEWGIVFPEGDVMLMSIHSVADIIMQL